MDITINIIILIFNIIIWFSIYSYKKWIDNKFNKEFEEYKNLLKKESEDYKRFKENDFKIYSDLINSTRCFTQDPSLTFNEAKKLGENFIVKYHNEVLAFSSKNLVESIEKVLYNSITKIPNNNELIESLKEMINKIRKEQWLEELDNINFHSLDIDELKKRYTK